MDVIKLCDKNSEMISSWKERGENVYGDEKIGFSITIDADGNLIAPLSYLNLTFLPFIEELKMCSKIEFKPMQS